jgi:tetratricopeptide (TPR) repeat protein
MLLLGSLGRLYAQQGRTGEAVEAYRQAVSLGERHFPQGHPELADVLEQYAELLLPAGRVSEAEECLARARAMRGQ